MRLKTIGVLAVLLASATSVQARVGGVTLKEDGDFYVLSNDAVTARISKVNGGLRSLVYKGIETLNVENPGNWSHNASTKDNQTTARISIDPATNGGGRAEVSVKGISGGKPMGSGPGGGAVADIEIRFAMERDTPGLYTYSIWTHKPEYPATNVGEARYYVKLNDDVFDWMTVDANRNMKALSREDWNYGVPLNMKEVRRITTGPRKGEVEHKYDYSANQFDVLAWGWSSTEKKVGVWFVNPTIEYLSGGPTKIELSAHRDATFNPDNKTAPAPPCLLNYWRGSHYGGSVLQVREGEAWNKVIGPFLVYCNSGESPDAMWKDALARSEVETAAWPYDWVKGVDYPAKSERSTVTGRIVLHDPLAKMSKLMVGLTAPDWEALRARGDAGAAGRGGALGEQPRNVSWQEDAKHYQFWARASDDGTFSIPNVRPGKYTLHAYATGVLGELVKTEIRVGGGGGANNLSDIDWTPVRHGRQLWEIGIPDRSAGEYLHGNAYWHWGWYLQYPKDFPNDVNYTVGQSDFRKDWNYVQVPRATDAEAKTPGTPTTWTIHFDLPDAPPTKGTATLRLGLCGTGSTTLTVGANGHPAGQPLPLKYNSVINRDSVVGLYTMHDIAFSASLLKQGANELKLSIPAGSVTDGIEYDYLRLELAE